MKRSLWHRVLRNNAPAGYFWVSLVCFCALVIASFLLFEQQIQDFLAHLELYLPDSPARKAHLALLLIALLALCQCRRAWWRCSPWPPWAASVATW